MGKVIHKGFQSSIEDAPSPTSIIFGANLAPFPKPKAEDEPVPELDPDAV